jgi:hypothetical protein
LKVDQQAIAMFHQRVACVRQVGLRTSTLFAKRAWGSVVLWCVAFERFSPRRLTVGLPGSSGGGSSDGGVSLARKLLILAAASMSVPSTLK